jgi:hypothetical protein
MKPTEIPHVAKPQMTVAFGICVAAAWLAACGGSQPPIGAPGAMRQSSAIATHADFGESWMATDAVTQDLIYVTNYSYVTVYSYPQGKLVGTLNGFKSTVGDCIDKKGDIFITNHVFAHGETRIAEYAHAGTKPIAELATKNVGPLGCSIDPTTGNLAISGGGSGTNGAGVDIFQLARGKPSYIRDPQMVFTQFCGFDDNGDLFVAGLKDFSGDPGLAELPKGSRKFVTIRLNAIIDSEGGVQWDGKHLAIGAYVPPGGTNATPVIYQFAIGNGRGTKVGTTTLGNPAHLTSFQFFITRGTVIVPNWYYLNSIEKHNVLFYRYPAGGSPTMTLAKHVSAPRGVVVSLAQSH